MPCYDLRGVYRRDGSPAFRPCGQCIGCRLEYSRQWAVRCYHEASLYDENCFITLTYNNENLPKDSSLDKTHVQKFLKRLRKRLEVHKKKIRYFGCGEYGDVKKTNRPHYHLCLFNYNFPDREIHRHGSTRAFKGMFKQTNNKDLYISKMLEDIWGKGFCTIGEVSFESAAYVARYVTKKVSGEKREVWYGEKAPEFAVMSRRPGIGAEWLKKYYTDVYPKDFHTLNGHKMRPNRYYDGLYEKMKPAAFEQIKQKRRYHGENKEYESHLRQWQKERHRNSITKRLERKFENGTSI